VRFIAERSRSQLPRAETGRLLPNQLIAQLKALRDTRPVRIAE